MMRLKIFMSSPKLVRCMLHGGLDAWVVVVLRGMPEEGRRQGKVMQQRVGDMNQSEEALNHVASKYGCRGTG